jgi:hypothetical protein
MIQQLFDNFMEENLSAERILAQVVKDKLVQKDIKITNKQFEKIENRIREWKNNILKYKDSQLNKEVQTLRFNDICKEDVLIELDFETDVEKRFDKSLKALTDSIPDIARETAEIIFKSLKKSFPYHQKLQTKDIKHFTKNIIKAWGKPISLLEMFLLIAIEAGNLFNNEYRESSAETNDYIFETLSRLHARGCQILSEIIVLLRNGFADGAHARWRTMHEIAVIAYFISKHGNDTAERYLYHDAIESYKAALKYQQHCEALGYEPLSDDELVEIKYTYDSMLNRFGKGYRNQYGWASFALNKNSPNFAEIEADVGLEHMRPYYKMASHNVHANPKGVFFKLGLMPEEDILLAGPSNIGLADPGHCAAVSLLQITTVLLTTKTNLDILVILNILKFLERQIGDEFLKTQADIEESTIT